MQPAKTTPEQALSLPPGMALNVFVFDYVLGGLAEDPNRIPNCSMAFGDCHMILIKIMAENQEDVLGVSFGQQHYDAAKSCRFVLTEKPVPTWKVTLGSANGYGRSFQEAVCKLAIMLQIRIDMLTDR